MSIPLRVVRSRIRENLKDTDARRPSFDSVSYDQAISSKYLYVRSRLPAPELLSTAAITITGGTATFTLPGTVTQYTGGDGQAEYAGGFRIRLTSNGQFLVKMTVEEIDARRNGDTAGGTGIPYAYCLWEDKDQAVQGRLYPTPTDNDTADLFHKLAADDPRDYIGSGSDDMDDVELHLSRQGVEALVLLVSADMLLRMTDDDLKLRNLNQAIAGPWKEEAEITLYQEEARHHAVVEAGRTQRWVS